MIAVGINPPPRIAEAALSFVSCRDIESKKVITAKKMPCNLPFSEQKKKVFLEGLSSTHGHAIAFAHLVP